MGSYFNGDNNAVNNSDGFSTGFIANKKKNRTNINNLDIDHLGGPNMNNTGQVPVQQPVQPPRQQMNNPQPGTNNFFGNQNKVAQPPRQPMNQPNNAKVHKINMNKAGQKTGAQLGTVKTKKVAKYLNYVSMGIFVILTIFILLVVGGVVKLGKKEEPAPEQPTEPVIQEPSVQDKMMNKLVLACSNISTDGSYGTVGDPIETNCELFTCFIEDNVLCENFVCMIAHENEAYSLNCETGKGSKANKDEFQASLNISDACVVLEGNPGYNGNIKLSYATCQNYVCDTTVGGKGYSGTCKIGSN